MDKMMDKKKHMADGILIGLLKKGKNKPDESMEDDDSDSPGSEIESLSEDLLGAIDNKDAAMVADTLKAIVELCLSEKDDEEY